jgi:hypothetical protein
VIVNAFNVANKVYEASQEVEKYLEPSLVMEMRESGSGR